MEGGLRSVGIDGRSAHRLARMVHPHDSSEKRQQACNDVIEAANAVLSRMEEADNDSVIPRDPRTSLTRVDERPPPSVPHVSIDEIHDVVKSTLEAKGSGIYERLGVHTTECPPFALVLKLRAGFALLNPNSDTKAGRLKTCFDQPIADDETQGQEIAACANYPPWIAHWASDDEEEKAKATRWLAQHTEEEMDHLINKAVCMTCTTHNDELGKEMPSVWYTCRTCGSVWQTDMVFFGLALRNP